MTQLCLLKSPNKNFREVVLKKHFNSIYIVLSLIIIKSDVSENWAEHLKD